MAPVIQKNPVSAFSVYTKRGVMKKKKKSLQTVKNRDKMMKANARNQDMLGDFTVKTKPQLSDSPNRPTFKKKKKKSSLNAMIIKENADDANKGETGNYNAMEENNAQMQIENLGSIEEGKLIFEWLVHPLRFDDFMKNPWEKRPYYGSRNDPSFYSSILSTSIIDKMLRENNIMFTKNVDITTYLEGKRETLNPPGRATAERVWEFYEKGCSVRFLNPQTFISQVGALVASLQEAFGCMVGTNVYLTPPGSQGFAPHYDDIEAFVLQIEGKKHWCVYAPRTDKELLPRDSSNNLSQEELKKPLLDIILNAGDILYFPRGFIHQANTVPGEHSLHVTLSCYQRNAWIDLLEKMVPAALTCAADEVVAFRKGLPTDCLQYMGVAHSDRIDSRRDAFKAHLRELFEQLWEHMPIDAAVDQMGKDFMHDAYPPVLTKEELMMTVACKGRRMSCGQVKSDFNLKLNDKIKLIRAHILRIVVEDDTETDKIEVYHYADNSKEYHGEQPQSFTIAEDMAPGVEFLMNSYPEFVEVSELPLYNNDEKLSLATDLWQRGLLFRSD